MDGIINIYKEKGFTSFDVVAKLRGILHIKKIGHTGTLDPDAEGVLPVCIGKATKVCELLTDKDKTYRAVVKLGVTTDTLDLSGKILSQVKSHICREELQAAAEQFVGEISQIPPMYSAIKINGKRLYQLAREGKTVERKPRNVVIHSLEIIHFSEENQEFTMEVSCSKGTYIRTLCDDIGQKLGCGAAMKELLRTKVGPFVLDEAVTLQEVEKKRDQGLLPTLIRPIDSVFTAYEKCAVSEDGMKILVNGNKLPQNMLSYLAKDGEKVRVYGADQKFYAIYEFVQKEKKYKIVKMFYNGESGSGE